MICNKNKIIRSVIVSQSLGFAREVMIKMRAMGYDMVAVTSPGLELDELRDKDEFSINEYNESLLLKCRAKKMYEILNKQVIFTQYIGTFASAYILSTNFLNYQTLDF